MESLKWKCTQIGSHNIMSVTFGETEVEIAINEEEAGKLQTILNASKHAYRTLSTENKVLQKELSKKLLAPEIEKTMIQWRDQLNALLKSDTIEVKSIGAEEEANDIFKSQINPDREYDSDYVSDEKALLNLCRAYKILGLTVEDLRNQRLIPVDANYLLSKYGLSWKKLGTDADRFFIAYCTVPMFEDDSRISRDAEKTVYNMVVNNEDYIVKSSKSMGIAEIAHDLNMPTSYVWAYCVAAGIYYFAYNNYYNALDGYHIVVKPAVDILDLDFELLTQEDANALIDDLGGINFLKRCKLQGMSQTDIAGKYHMKQYYISHYAKEHGELWSTWPRE